jgi:hypothetical protein
VVVVVLGSFPPFGGGGTRVGEESPPVIGGGVLKGLRWVLAAT